MFQYCSEDPTATQLAAQTVGGSLPSSLLKFVLKELTCPCSSALSPCYLHLQDFVSGVAQAVAVT